MELKQILKEAFEAGNSNAEKPQKDKATIFYCFDEWYNEIALKQVKKLNIDDVSKPLEVEIYATCDDLDGDIYAVFDSEKRCKIEAEESGCGMKTMTLYKGERI